MSKIAQDALQLSYDKSGLQRVRVKIWVVERPQVTLVVSCTMFPCVVVTCHQLIAGNVSCLQQLVLALRSTNVRLMYSVSQKNPNRGPDIFSFFSQTVENFLSIFYAPIIRSYLR